MTDPALKATPSHNGLGQIYPHRFGRATQGASDRQWWVSATVVVTVRQGQVWMSIQPSFTWDAIMEPWKVAELVRTLALAAEGANEMGARHGRNLFMTTLELGQRLYTALDAQEWAQVQALISTGLVVQVGSAPPMDLDQWRRNQEAFYAGFPDGHHVIDDYLVDGSRLVTRCRFEGTHTGTFGEWPPTRASISVGVIHIDRFEGERLVEHHGQFDMLGLLQQIGEAAPRGDSGDSCALFLRDADQRERHSSPDQGTAK
jgi:predicted ester cyclase